MGKKKHPGGRPPLWNNCLDLDMAGEMYFESCLYEDDGDYILRKEPIPITVTGLALALHTSRETLMNYEKKAEFFDTVKRLKTVCENYAETRMYYGNAAGPIFALKNFGWRDKQEQELYGKGGEPLQPTTFVVVDGGKDKG